MKYQKKQVEAMRELLTSYKERKKGNIPQSYHCPLCVIVRNDKEEDDNLTVCKDCVWYHETKQKCFEFSQETFNDSILNLITKNHRIWIDYRIKTLKRWIKKYKEKK